MQWQRSLALLVACLPVCTASWPTYTPISTKSGWFSSFGNHRFNISVPPGHNGGVLATVQWRRSDPDPLAKAVYLTTDNHTLVGCSFVGDPNADVVTLSFNASADVTQYRVYYMSFSTCEYPGGSCTYDAQSVYNPQGSPGSCTPNTGAPFPSVTVQALYEPRAPFESFDPMEMPMTAHELQAFMLARGPLVVIPEDREHPVKMRTQLPHRWVTAPAAFEGRAQPGEHFSFQLVVINIDQPTDLHVTNVSFSSLRNQNQPGLIPSSALRCLNTGGSDFWGRDFSTQPTLSTGELKPLWVVVVIPLDASPGAWTGQAVVHTNRGSSTMNLTIRISGAPIANGGDDQISRATRIHWFDSKLGLGDDSIPSPYTPITVASTLANQPALTMLGKEVHLASTGLPTQLLITADQAGSPPLGSFREILASDLQLMVGGRRFDSTALTLGTATNMSVNWSSTQTDPKSATVSVAGSVDCTGYALYNITVQAHTALADAGVTVGLLTNPLSAQFAMGLGRPGGEMSRWAQSSRPSFASWLVLDFGTDVELDGLRLYSHGDNVHDVSAHFLQASVQGSTPQSIRWGRVVGNFSGGMGVTGPQPFKFSPATARVWRWVVTDVHSSGMCADEPHCQPDVAEIEFSRVGVGWVANNGTAAASLVVSSSGVVTTQNAAWKAVDGRLVYQDYKEGWDAAQLELPDTPFPPAPGDNRTMWRWDGKNGNNGLWVGNTKAGVRLELKGDDPLWWAGSPYDSGASPEPPVSWSNNGKGGIEAYQNGTAFAFSGPRAMSAGENISYIFSLMLTPVRPVDQAERFGNRWAQLSGNANYSGLKEAGVSVVNMHQGNPINPWINYPYLTNVAMKSAADACHALGIKFSVYNTMRELSDRCTEYWVMISLNDTLVPGDGGGADWLQEHVRGGYLPAWSNTVSSVPGTRDVPNPDPAEGPYLQDAGMRVRALSRWNNYYIAGLVQIQRDYQADGIYLDEIAYDRTTMLRARKMLGDSGMIDHHADHGFVSSSPAMNYMELYPFINRLWYGEGFDYNTDSPDYWLIEIGAVPTGLSADMLRYETMKHSHGMTRYHYRGMLVGSGFRLMHFDGASDPFDPTALWGLWDSFGIQNATMVGWWEDIEQGRAVVPVQSSNPDVKVTVYLKKGIGAMIALADWNEVAANVSFTLSFDWEALGLVEGEVKLSAPALPPFQPSGTVYTPGAPMVLNVNDGGLILLVEQN